MPLHEQYVRQGFQVLAVPCNQFGDGNTYEPDANAVVQAFVQERTQMFTPAGQTPRQFPVLAKSTVNDPMCTERGTASCAPGSVACCSASNVVYEYLKDAATGLPGDVGWNFDKFLVGKDGSVLSRYAAGTAVDGCGPSWGGCTQGLRRDIEAALQAGGGPADSVAGDRGPFTCDGKTCPATTVDCGYLSVACTTGRGDAMIGEFSVTLSEDGVPISGETSIESLCAGSCATCQDGTYDHDQDPSTDCVACPRGNSCRGGPCPATCWDCSAGTWDDDMDPSTACAACPDTPLCGGGRCPPSCGKSGH